WPWHAQKIERGDVRSFHWQLEHDRKPASAEIRAYDDIIAGWPGPGSRWRWRCPARRCGNTGPNFNELDSRRFLTLRTEPSLRDASAERECAGGWRLFWRRYHERGDV